jgi:hypothetical protein
MDSRLRAQPALGRNTSPDLRKRRSRFPPHTLSGNLNLIIQLIDLLQGKTLGLIDHEVHEGDAQEAACEPDEEDLGLEVSVSWAPVYEVGSRVCDGPVEQPVCGRRHREGFSANLERARQALSQYCSIRKFVGGWGLNVPQLVIHSDGRKKLETMLTKSRQ